MLSDPQHLLCLFRHKYSLPNSLVTFVHLRYELQGACIVLNVLNYITFFPVAATHLLMNVVRRVMPDPPEARHTCMHVAISHHIAEVVQVEL